MTENTGFIVVLAYPDTIVKPATRELISKVWPLLGVGGNKAVQAGHAALLLIKKETNKIAYYDFGRYITSDGMGRVRNVDTDCEVHIPMEVVHNGTEILNLDEILLFLEANPEKTHGEGRMIATVCTVINYEKALAYVQQLQAKVEVPYGAFIPNGSNCARFVTDTLIQSTTEYKLKRRLILSKSLTPSPISNVINTANGGKMFSVLKGVITPYRNRSISKEHWQCFFNKVPQVLNRIGTEVPDENAYVSEKGQWLSGVGSGAWFELKPKTKEVSDVVVISRKCAKGTVNVEATFKTNKPNFEISNPYEFLHGSNCAKCFIRQGDEVFEFVRVN
ncbi:DUF6695 family protein [Flavicella sediminum]|uniref:DUF6695 family protein n=1 Tax=Flavicella sediminum TaxID=2585141 RepID=UPI0011216077|nr:DUF6695 family protein [Flavicella sediminum]